MPRKPVDFFGEDSPLFAPPKKKVVKKKLIVKKRKRKKLALDELFDAKKPTPKKRGPKSHAQLAEEKIIAENKRIAKKRRARDKNITKKPTKVHPKVDRALVLLSPHLSKAPRIGCSRKDCHHIHDCR